MSESGAVAPGKLLLVGEYAVLEGAPALVAAVNRYVHVRVRAAPGDGGTITCTPLGVCDERFRVAGGRVLCRNGVAARLGLTASLLPRIVEVLTGSAESLQGLAIEIDSGQLFEQSGAGSDRAKLGLGSSAAVTAASIVALEGMLGGVSSPPEAPSSRLRRWLPIYRELLGGRASGADLAASLSGGLVEFRDPADRPPAMAERRWPEGLNWLPVWVGKPASTTGLVAAFDRWRLEQGKAASVAISELSKRSSIACAALDRPVDFLEALSDYADALDAMGRQSGIEIVSAPHRALMAAAEGVGVVYKSCGAGGGDIGVALSQDPERLRAFEAGLARIGALPLHLAVARTGSAPEPIAGGS